MVPRVVPVLLVLALCLLPHTRPSPAPGHLVHDFYKCTSKFYYDFSRCRLQREEEARRRGINRRSRQIHLQNSAETFATSLAVTLAAVFWTQKLK